MITTIRKMIFFVLCLLLFMAPVAVAEAYSSQVKVYIDDREITFPDAKPFVQTPENRTLVPLRLISENLGATVGWDDKTKTVTINKGDQVIKMQINRKTLTKNGVNQQMDVAPIIRNSRTMVPIRFVSEYLGVGVDWDEKTYRVEIYTDQKPGNLIELPTDPDNLDKAIQKMAKDNSSIGNLYMLDREATKDYIVELDNMIRNLDDPDLGAGFISSDTRTDVFTDSNGHDIRLRQFDRTKAAFDATWVFLDMFLENADANKVWYRIVDYLNDLEDGDETISAYSGSLTNYNYTVEGMMPAGIQISFDKK